MLPVTRGVFCSSCDRKFIFSDKKYSFFHRKSALWHERFFFIPVTGNKFCVTRNILCFTWTWTWILDIFHVKRIVPPFTRSTVCITWSIFSVARTIFLWQRIVFLWSLGHLLGVSHFYDKCTRFTIKISCETLRFRGNLVPRFPVIIPPCYTFTNLKITLFLKKTTSTNLFHII